MGPKRKPKQNKKRQDNKKVNNQNLLFQYFPNLNQNKTKIYQNILSKPNGVFKQEKKLGRQILGEQNKIIKEINRIFKQLLKDASHEQINELGNYFKEQLYKQEQKRQIIRYQKNLQDMNMNNNQIVYKSAQIKERQICNQQYCQQQIQTRTVSVKKFKNIELDDFEYKKCRYEQVEIRRKYSQRYKQTDESIQIKRQSMNKQQSQYNVNKIIIDWSDFEYNNTMNNQISRKQLIQQQSIYHKEQQQMSNNSNNQINYNNEIKSKCNNQQISSYHQGLQPLLNQDNNSIISQTITLQQIPRMNKIYNQNQSIKSNSYQLYSQTKYQPQQFISQILKQQQHHHHNKQKQQQQINQTFIIKQSQQRIQTLFKTKFKMNQNQQYKQYLDQKQIVKNKKQKQIINKQNNQNQTQYLQQKIYEQSEIKIVQNRKILQMKQILIIGINKLIQLMQNKHKAIQQQHKFKQFIIQAQQKKYKSYPIQSNQYINTNQIHINFNSNISKQQYNPNISKQQNIPNISKQQRNPNISKQQRNPNISKQQNYDKQLICNINKNNSLQFINNKQNYDVLDSILNRSINPQYICFFQNQSNQFKQIYHQIKDNNLKYKSQDDISTNQQSTPIITQIENIQHIHNLQPSFQIPTHFLIGYNKQKLTSNLFKQIHQVQLQKIIYQTKIIDTVI